MHKNILSIDFTIKFRIYFKDFTKLNYKLYRI